MDCPGQESALLSTSDDFAVLNHEKFQVKRYVHLQDRKKTFSMHVQLTAGHESEVAVAFVSHVTPSEEAVVALHCP